MPPLILPFFCSIQVDGEVAQLTLHESLGLPECFVSCYRSYYPDCHKAYFGCDLTQLKNRNRCSVTSFGDRSQRCSPSSACINLLCPLRSMVLLFRCCIRDLSDGEEIELFEQNSDIKGDHRFVFHNGISFETQTERFEHWKALEEFDTYRQKRDDLGDDFVKLFPEQAPLINCMVKLITSAEEIRRFYRGGSATTFTTLPVELTPPGTTETESVNDTKKNKQPSGQKRNVTGDREERIKKAASEYFTKLLNGKDVTKEAIAIQHGLEKSVLSKADVKKKFGLDKIEDEIEEAKRLFGSIAKIDLKEASRLSNSIYNTLCR